MSSAVPSVLGHVSRAGILVTMRGLDDLRLQSSARILVHDGFSLCAVDRFVRGGDVKTESDSPSSSSEESEIDKRSVA